MLLTCQSTFACSSSSCTKNNHSSMIKISYLLTLRNISGKDVCLKVEIFCVWFSSCKILNQNGIRILFCYGCERAHAARRGICSSRCFLQQACEINNSNSVYTSNIFNYQKSFGTTLADKSEFRANNQDRTAYPNRSTIMEKPIYS